jgi:hypothetical protein
MKEMEMEMAMMMTRTLLMVMRQRQFHLCHQVHCHRWVPRCMRRALASAAASSRKVAA